MDSETPRPARLSGPAAVMFDAMSAISEAAHNVRWAPNTEHRVWRLLMNSRGRWGRARADHADVAPALALLSVLVWQAGIWIVWPKEQRAPTAIPVDNWRALHLSAPPARKRRKRRA